MPAHRFARTLVSPSILVELVRHLRAHGPTGHGPSQVGRTTTARVSGFGRLLPARSPLLRLALRRAVNGDRDAYQSTSASHYIDYEYPRLIGSQLLSKAFALPLDRTLARTPRRLGGLAFHDA